MRPVTRNLFTISEKIVLNLLAILENLNHIPNQNIHTILILNLIPNLNLHILMRLDHIPNPSLQIIVNQNHNHNLKRCIMNMMNLHRKQNLNPNQHTKEMNTHNFELIVPIIILKSDMYIRTMYDLAR